MSSFCEDGAYILIFYCVRSFYISLVFYFLFFIFFLNFLRPVISNYPIITIKCVISANHTVGVVGVLGKECCALKDLVLLNLLSNGGRMLEAFLTRTFHRNE